MTTLARILLSLVLLASTPAVAARYDCGQPTSTGDRPTSADALAVLRASVGILNDCAANSCICDANGNGSVQVSDALLVLKFAVGQPVTLNCICPGTTTTSSTTTTLPDLCPRNGPPVDLTMDCRNWIYTYVWDRSVVEAFLTDGSVIALGQSDGVNALYYAGIITSPTKFALSLMGTGPDNLLPVLEAGSGGSINNGGDTLNVVIKLDGKTYKFNDAVYNSTLPASIAAARESLSRERLVAVFLAARDAPPRR